MASSARLAVVGLIGSAQYSVGDISSAAARATPSSITSPALSRFWHLFALPIDIPSAGTEAEYPGGRNANSDDWVVPAVPPLRRSIYWAGLKLTQLPTPKRLLCTTLASSLLAVVKASYCG